MDESKYILFDKYLNNELADVELKSFEEQLLSNEDFKQEFEIYKALETSLASKFENEEDEIALRKTLQNLGNQHIKENETAKKETTVISLFNYKKLLVAASIAILIGLFVFNNGNPVYGDFANHNSLELVVRGENNDAIVAAEKAFNSKKYEEALKQLTVLSDEYSDDVEIELYKGICNLELNNYTNAEQIFTKISNGNSSFSTKAIWYKALNYLKQEKFEDCKVVLQTIPESAEEYKQAQKLLKKL
jgi:hypothetical protein